MDNATPRRIVVCVDGTNNHPGAGYTNIQRLVRMLDADAGQLIYYQPGAGTIEPPLALPLSRRVMMFVDSVSAVMLQRHVCAAYRFLMAHYRPGDQLYFFGFSRGAYAVRVLAGMLGKVGLLREGFDEMVPFAWRTYLARGNRDAASEFRNAYGHYVRGIRFLGLFDCVSAIGSPWRPRTFERTFRNRSVQTVRHALALDERRAMFVPNLWADSDTPEDDGEGANAATDVAQVCFAGVHADIGGGYPDAEAGLSLIPLAWMKQEAEHAGLRFRPRVSARLLDPGHQEASSAEAVGARHATARAHDELAAHWYWRLMEACPLPRWRRDEGERWTRRWRPHLGKPRYLPPSATHHASVQARIDSVAGYRPAAKTWHR